MSGLTDGGAAALASVAGRGQRDDRYVVVVVGRLLCYYCALSDAGGR